MVPLERMGLHVEESANVNQTKGDGYPAADRRKCRLKTRRKIRNRRIAIVFYIIKRVRECWRGGGEKRTVDKNMSLRLNSTRVSLLNFLPFTLIRV